MLKTSHYTVLDSDDSMNFKVGEWTVQPANDRIVKGGETRVLRPQVMDILTYLADRPGDAVSNEELLDKLWPGKIVTQGTLYNAVNELRRGLEDDASQPRYIETIPKRGYRLIAEVVPEAGPESISRKVAGSPAAQQETSQKARFKQISLYLAAVLVVVASWFFVDRLTGPSPVAIQPGRLVPDRSIAVLPFVDMSAEGNQQYFADGISEEIISIISQHPDLKVVGRTSSFALRENGEDLREIGRKLDVAQVLEGSVRREGQRLRITAQLVSANDGYHLWSETFESEVGDIFRIQDEIAAAVAERLQLDLHRNNAPSSIATDRAPASLEAHDLFLLARYRLNRGRQEDVQEAIRFLEEALELDPEYAQAHAELAYALYLTFSSGWAPSDERWPLVAPDGPINDHARTALALDPDLAAAYAIQGAVNNIDAVNGQRLPESAELAYEQLRRALELNPNDARALVWLGDVLQFRGAPHTESLRLAKRAIEVEPLDNSATWFYLAMLTDMPDRREEKWSIIRKIESGEIEWSGSANTLVAAHLGREGNISEAVIRSEQDHPHEEDPLAWNVHEGSLLALGEFDRVIELTEGVDVTPARRTSWEAKVYAPGRNLDPGTHYCSFDDEVMGTTFVLNRCAHALLLAGQYDAAERVMGKHLPEDWNEFLTQYGYSFSAPRNAALTMATLHTIRDDREQAQMYIDAVEEFLDGLAPEPDFKATYVSVVRAQLHALKGEKQQSVNELNKAIEWGWRHFGIFMEPAYLPLHDFPPYQELQQRWLALINADRADLGLQPLGLSPDAGPGVVPFAMQ